MKNRGLHSNGMEEDQPQVISGPLLDSVLALQLPKSITAYRDDLTDESGATRADVRTLSLDFQRNFRRFFFKR